jgi:hypothetical protein
VRKIKLAAVWLPDETRILVDSSLPTPKQEWASFHDSVHRLLEWHRAFFLGDTAQTLDPGFQEQLELEANYGAGALMFCGGLFTKEARNVSLDWAGVEAMRRRYGKKSYVTTLRRFVEHGQEHPMVMVVSTPWWKVKPADQKSRVRHFVVSRAFAERFSGVARDEVLAGIDVNTVERVGGPVGDFTVTLVDDNGLAHEFRGECFFNRHYVLTLLVCLRGLSGGRGVVSSPV